MMNTARNTSAVREPTDAELGSFQGLKDILAWAGIKGNPDLEYTQAGSLLFAIAGDEFQTVPAEEFASVAPADYEEALSNWKYSQHDEDFGNGNPECHLVPNALVKSRARAAHRAARIWKKLEFSTNATNAIQCMDRRSGGESKDPEYDTAGRRSCPSW